MSDTVCFFHTVAGLSGRFDELSAEHIPAVEHFHIVDESVLDELLDVGEMTPGIRSRICVQLQLAERAGADVILDTCSSTSPAVDVARDLVDVPIIKIDDPMAEQAVEIGDHVTVLATAESTIGPSTALVERKAADSSNSVEVESVVIPEALEARTTGDVERHDELIVENALEYASRTDVLVLAQASMAHLESVIADRTDVPVLSSPQRAMETLSDTLRE